MSRWGTLQTSPNGSAGLFLPGLLTLNSFRAGMSVSKSGQSLVSHLAPLAQAVTVWGMPRPIRAPRPEAAVTDVHQEPSASSRIDTVKGLCGRKPSQMAGIVLLLSFCIGWRLNLLWYFVSAWCYWRAVTQCCTPCIFARYGVSKNPASGCCEKGAPDFTGGAELPCWHPLLCCRGFSLAAFFVFMALLAQLLSADCATTCQTCELRPETFCLPFTAHSLYLRSKCCRHRRWLRPFSSV